MIKLLIVEEYQIMKKSLEILLARDEEFQIVESFEKFEDTLEFAKIIVPDVVLIDTITACDGIKYIRALKESIPKVKIITFTSFDEEEYIFNALGSGVNGYLLKDITVDKLIESIKIIHSGWLIVDPFIATKFFQIFCNMAGSKDYIDIDKKYSAQLNQSERMIIHYIGQGMSNKEISEKINFSEGTVRNYISDVLSKLNLRDRTQIAIFAINMRL